MGRTAAYTQEQVFEAADKLAAIGQEVTPDALRDVDATVDQMRQQIEALQADSIRDRKQIEDLITRPGRAEGGLEASRANTATKRQPKAGLVRPVGPNA